MSFAPAALLCCLAMTGAALRGDTEASKAAMSGQIEKLRAMAKAGLDLNGPDKWGWTPLLWAIYYKQDGAANWLLLKGADPNRAATEKYRSFNAGTTPLMLACNACDAARVSALLDYQARPGALDAKGQDAMAIARRNEAVDCIAALGGRPKETVPSRLHSRFHPVAPGKITSVLIVLASELEQPGTLLGKVEAALKTALDQRKIPFRILRQAPGPSTAAEATAMKAGYILAMKEASASFAHLQGPRSGVKPGRHDDPVRLNVTFHTSLRTTGQEAPLWSKDINAADSGENSALGYLEDVGANLVEELMDELEGDLLL